MVSTIPPLPRCSLRLSAVAAGVWGGLACSVDPQPVVTVAAADSADQVVYGLDHRVTVDGLLRAIVEADTAYFYQNTQTADLIGVHVIFHSPQGAETSSLTAIEGTYEWRTGDMEARGDVVAVTPDGRRLTTSALSYGRRRDQIVSPEPFVFTAPGRHLEGEGFTSDPDFRNVVTTRPRRGTLGEVELRP